MAASTAWRLRSQAFCCGGDGLVATPVDDVFAQGVAVMIAGKGECAQHQSALVRDHNGAFDAEFIRLACLAFADAFNLGACSA